jgi:Peptidase A4 family
MTNLIAKRLATVLAAALSALAIGLALVPLAAAAESSAVSQNWSGYAVTGALQSSRFSRVAGTWVQPSGTCRRGQETYSVTWVGLGGFNSGSKALEQTGTAVDCSSSGQAQYSAWYELVPAAPVTMRLTVHPDDEISASVAEKAGQTIMQVQDLSTHASRTVARRFADPDISSAEWIVEAPSLCFTATRCTPLPLTDFGTVPFSNASVATDGSQRAAIDASSLKVTRLELRDEARAAGRRLTSSVTPASGIASPLSANGTAFTVTWGLLEGEGAQQPSPQESQSSQGLPGITSAAASIRR